MGFLLDGFKWSRSLKVLGPLLLAIYFSQSHFHWHYSECKTKLKFSLFGHENDYFLTDVAQNAVFNAAVFFYAQSFYAFWYGDRASVLSATAILKWQRRSLSLKNNSELQINDL